MKPWSRIACSGFVLLLMSACAHLAPRPETPQEVAQPVGSGTQLDKWIDGPESRHPGKSAFRLVTDGTEAFVLRERSARYAGRSLDVQTYIWHADVTGQFLAQSLLEAADRGVKVRLLVDDMDARAKNAGFAALAAHPNIRVRLFNPFASRKGFLGMLGEGLTSFQRINRRMHNKSWIADNRIAIVGGRNVGDEYFDASAEMNFVDLDFAMVGPIVRDVESAFDRYWNAPAAYPMEVLDPAGVNAEALQKLRTVLAASAEEAHEGRYATALREGDAVRNLLEGDWPMEWAANSQFITDDPLKVTMKRRDAKRAPVSSTLVPLIQAAQNDATIMSPYFVPGRKTTQVLITAAQSGKQVHILTNSLAANDVAAVHGGYSRYRRPLLAGGVRLWEIKPRDGTRASSTLLGSSGASLHTKALSVDSSTLFVGSFNIDPRSIWLNCEQGVLVENPVLAKQFNALFAEQVLGAHAWTVDLQNGHLRWSDDKDSFSTDPKASAKKRFEAWIARILHLDAHL